MAARTGRVLGIPALARIRGTDGMAHAQCLCGAVSFEAEILKPEVQACHCGQCQRWTGGGPLYAMRVGDVSVTGEENIQTYHASGHGERAFCRVCGSTLYWKMQGGQIAFLSPGLFDALPEGTRLTEEIFVDCRAGWLPPVEGAAQHDEAEMQQQLQDYLARKGQA